MVVEGTEVIEGFLELANGVPTGPRGDHFQIEGAVESFLFALCLGVERSDVAGSDSEISEPHGERCPWLADVVAPW